MGVKEKLVELLQDENNPVWMWFPNNASMMHLADYLTANGVTVQEWISVCDELPEVGKFVLIYNEINGVLLDYYAGATFGYYDVTHWMPRPNPPQGE